MSKPDVEQPEVWIDSVAGWLGGISGIIVSNPLEVLKTRYQTYSPTPSLQNLPRSPRAGHGVANTIPASQPSMRQLWKSEGWRMLFAGAAGPIFGLALIDSAFFMTYGQVLALQGETKEDPKRLAAPFLAAVTGGSVCALLETPVEVVKCRDQVDQRGKAGGSFAIARQIARQEGLRGFYVGFAPNLIHDSLSSGIFFSTYHLTRRQLRKHIKSEELTNFCAGGLAGLPSALLPYPLDTVKTRLQTANSVAAPLSKDAPPPSFWRMTRQMFRDQKLVFKEEGRIRHTTIWRTLFLIPDARIRERLALNIVGLKALYRGIGTTCASSFVASASTMLVIEATVKWLNAAFTR